MSKYRAEKCSADGVCVSMDRQLVNAELVAQSGFQIIEQLVQKERKLAVVVYKKTAKDKPWQINICPWCEGRPGFANQSKDAQK